MNFEKGDPINPKKLESTIINKFDSIGTAVQNLIPIGFNELYNVVSSKIFNIRPKVDNPIYSTRSGSNLNAIEADTTQPNIGAVFLNTPWTQELASSFGVNSYANINRGSLTEPYLKITPKVPYNPASDLFGGVPLRGNNPFLFRGFVGLSNWFEDSNIRFYVDETGGTMTLKAKQLSLYSPYTELADESEEYIYEEGIRLSKPINNFTKVVDCSGLAEGDYLVYAEGTSAYDSIDIALNDVSIGFKSVNDLETDYGVRWTGNFDGSSIGTSLRYERPLAVAYSNGTGVEVSQVTAWEESIGTALNADPAYTKQYQQCTSTDTTVSLNTVTNDRRLIPAYYYFNLDNDNLVNTVTYNGLVRDIPGAGGNKVTIEAPEWNDGSPNLSVHVDQCELTNGLGDSLWIRDLDLGPDDIIFVNGDVGDPFQNRGLYLWLVANIRDSSITGTSHQGVNGYSLQYGIWAHSSPTWDAIENNSGVSRNILWYAKDDTFRCRIGWVSSDENFANIPVTIVDGHHIYKNVNRFWADSNAPLKHLTLGTSSTTNVTNDPAWTSVSLNQCKVLPVWNNNGLGATTTSTSVTCTSIDIELWNVSGTRTTGTSWVGVTTDTMSTAAGVDINAATDISDIPAAKTIIVDATNEAYIYNKNDSITVGTGDTIYWSALGADGGSFWDGQLKMAIVKGFYLPFSYE